MMNLLFCDVETTGLDPVVHRPWEVCAVAARIDGTELRCAEPFLVQVWWDSEIMEKADPQALTIGRFAERSGASYIAARTGELLAMYVTGHAPDDRPRFVGIVPSFDTRMLEHLIPASNMPWHHRLICARTLAIGDLSCDAIGDAETALMLTTGEVLARYGLCEVPDEAHTALGDVRMTIGLFAAVLGLTVEAMP